MMASSAISDIDTLSQQKRTVFDLLQRNDVATLAQIEEALYHGSPPPSGATRTRNLIPKMRDRLRDRGWNIRSVFGVGYRLERRSER